MSGSTLLDSSYLEGRAAYEQALGVAVYATGAATVVGESGATPEVSLGSYGTFLAESSEAFVAKIAFP